MSAIKPCEVHGEWVDDGTTDDCPECIADSIFEARVLAQEADVDGGVVRGGTANG